MERREEQLERFRCYLRQEEKAPQTIDKYCRDTDHFLRFASGREITKELVLEYKEALAREFQISSANSMLAAVSCFLSCWP